ncbi:MAG: DCC1-like thiol-disulfide oxidoreductase family protein, partial [Acidobacteria bacterium]|nr:DCC1-like thiol-disulfide oxidoreductase family protein [Acidobacteriota bacterium]
TWDVVPDTSSNTLVLYDGVCGLCNGLNQFLLKRDPDNHFRFASLQSEFAASLLKRYDISAVDLDTVYVVADYGQSSQRLFARSDAVLHVVGQLGGVWSVFRAGRALPKAVREALYNVVARHRYRVFGKYEVCLMPEEKYRKRFLDLVTTKPS